jgi:hypothetical protein
LYLDAAATLERERLKAMAAAVRIGAWADEVAWASFISS